MSTSRRTFIKTVGAAGAAMYASDIIADLLAQTPAGNVTKSKFKGLADIVLTEAKRQGCSYADVRFTMNSGLGGGSANFTTAGAAAVALVTSPPVRAAAAAVVAAVVAVAVAAVAASVVAVAAAAEDAAVASGFPPTLSGRRAALASA